MGIVEEALASADRIADMLSRAGYRGDFTPESLVDVERFIDDEAPDGVIRPRGLIGVDIDKRVCGLGFYLGEVIRRAIGGRWEPGDNGPAWPIALRLVLPEGVWIWPVQRVMNRIKFGPENEVVGYALWLGVRIDGRTRNIVSRGTPGQVPPPQAFTILTGGDPSRGRGPQARHESGLNGIDVIRKFPSLLESEGYVLAQWTSDINRYVLAGTGSLVGMGDRPGYTVDFRDGGDFVLRFETEELSEVYAVFECFVSGATDWVGTFSWTRVDDTP